MPTAVPHNDHSSGRYQAITLDLSGTTGVRYWLVDTADTILALTAPEMGEPGDAWSLAYPDLILKRLSVEEVVKGPDAGWSIFRADYGYNQAQILTPGGKAGDKWTDIKISQTSANVRYGTPTTLHAGNPNTNLQIANGDGATREIGQVEAVVSIYKAKDDAGLASYFAAALDLATANPLNSTPLVLPRLRGTGVVWTMPAKQARYKSFEIATSSSVIEFRHTLQLAKSFEQVWRRQDKDGKAVGDPLSTWIDPLGDLSVVL